MAAVRTVVLVGHCGFDASSLAALVRAAAPATTVVSVNDEPELAAHNREDCLWLVNRVLDGSFGPGGGLGLIGRHAGTPATATRMLISNYADAQDQAVASGAVRGFGKSELHTRAAQERLRLAVEARQPA